jgi:hypothetical protein
MILLEPVVQIDVDQMLHCFAEFMTDGRRVSIVPIGRTPVRNHAGHHFLGTKRMSWQPGVIADKPPERQDELF